MTVKDGFYVQVGGTVARVFQTKNGEAFELHSQTEREQYPQKVTVWCAPDPAREGDRVSVKGWFTDTLAKYTKQDGSEGVTIRRSINGAQIVEHEPKVAQFEAEGWAGSTGAPF